MNGTLAIWYEPISGADRDDALGQEATPELEVHFNLWRDDRSVTNFLDIGVRLVGIDSVHQIYIYFPFEVDGRDFCDLSNVLRSSDSLNSVFNSVMSVERSSDDYFVAKFPNDSLISIFRFDKNKDIKFLPMHSEISGAGTRVTFSNFFIQKIKDSEAKDAYIRFRVYLNPKNIAVFTQEQVAKDRFFVSSASRIEVTELRLGESRSFPSEIARDAKRNQFKLTRVHYFLIREIGHKLVMQHAPLRKVRRLEDKIWASYLKGRPLKESERNREAKLAGRLVIYHWKEGDKENKIDDFTAFACFETHSTSLIFYIIGILFLSAVGGVIGDIGSEKIGVFRTLGILLFSLFILIFLARYLRCSGIKNSIVSFFKSVASRLGKAW